MSGTNSKFHKIDTEIEDALDRGVSEDELREDPRYRDRMNDPDSKW